MSLLGSNVCAPCVGRGNQFKVLDGAYTWATCLACSGRGAKRRDGPDEIPVRGMKARKAGEPSAKANQETSG